MSRDINRIMLLGRLGADPVLRFTKNGTPVTNFSLATENFSKAKNEAETTWHRIVTWGKPAERANEELKKGMSVFLEGGMKVRKYQDEEGEVHYIHEVHVDKINFLHRKTKLASGESSLETVSNEDPLSEIAQ